MAAARKLAEDQTACETCAGQSLRNRLTAYESPVQGAFFWQQDREEEMKTTSPIASLFGKSPIKPMQEHMRIVNECVAEVPKLFEALIAGDKDGVERAKEAIFAKEHEADALAAGHGERTRRPVVG
jgi:hypothetical protein